MIAIGLSTSDGFIGKTIRAALNSKVSHAVVLMNLWGERWVLESVWDGVVMVPFSRWVKYNTLVESYATGLDDKAALSIMKDLGTPYDYGSMLGLFFAIVAKWFRVKIKNPLSSSKAIICSELAVRLLQANNFKNSETLDAESTTPEDLRVFLERSL